MRLITKVYGISVMVGVRCVSNSVMVGVRCVSDGVMVYYRETRLMPQKIKQKMFQLEP